MSLIPEAPAGAVSVAASLWEQAPDLPETLPALLRQAARHHPAQPAIVDGDVTLSYAELLERSQAVARSLVALGVQAGDRVAIWAPNLHEWILAACGTHAAGAVLVPLNTRMKGAEAADILARSGTKVLFCIGDFLGQYYPALLDGQRPASLQHIVVLRDGFKANPYQPGDMSWSYFMGQGCLLAPSDVLAREQMLEMTQAEAFAPIYVRLAHGRSESERPEDAQRDDAGAGAG